MSKKKSGQGSKDALERYNKVHEAKEILYKYRIIIDSQLTVINTWLNNLRNKKEITDGQSLDMTHLSYEGNETVFIIRSGGVELRTSTNQEPGERLEKVYEFGVLSIEAWEIVQKEYKAYIENGETDMEVDLPSFDKDMQTTLVIKPNELTLIISVPYT